MWRNMGHTDWDYFGAGEAGVLGSTIPLTGTHGGSLLANESVGSGRYYRVEVKTLPASGTLFLNIDGSGTLTGAAGGSYTLEYYVWENAKKLSDADGVAIATFNIGGYSAPDGIAPTTMFGVPTQSAVSFDQTSTPTGIAATTGIGVAQAYLSGGLQTSTPTSIDSTVAFGTPTSAFSGVYWVETGDTTTIWTEI